MTNTPMTFEEWYWSNQTEDESNKPEYEWASMAWQASQAQQAQTIAELVEALEDARQTIRAWHGPMEWNIYDTHSPEMKRLNGAIAKVKGK